MRPSLTPMELCMHAHAAPTDIPAPGRAAKVERFGTAGLPHIAEVAAVGLQKEIFQNLREGHTWLFPNCTWPSHNALEGF